LITKYIPIILVVAILLGCSSHEELAPPDNPFDPGNPDYVSPSVVVIDGPNEGEVLDVTSTFIEWEGNESATEYRYKFDTPDWSSWGASTSHTFDYLDEGNHSFEIQARSVNGDEQTDSQLLDFVVNAVAGPSAIVYPYKQAGNPGDTLVYQIMAEEVTDLFAVECNISIDDEYFELIEVIDGNILGEWGGEALRIQDVTESSVSLSLVAVEGVMASFTGSTSIITLIVRIKSAAFSTSYSSAIDISNITYLNPDLETIDIAGVRSGGIHVY
jgi:hypothetical protein